MSRTLLSRLRDDEGIALATVMGWTTVLLIFMTAITGYVLGGMRSARADQDFHAALGVAEAGLDDFLVRLNRDANAWQPVDCTASPGDARCGFVPVPGGNAAGEYTYRVNADNYLSQGDLLVEATGRVGEHTRTVEVAYRRTNFLEYIYFTEYEAVPPWWYDQTDRPQCARHAHAGRPGPPTCDVIRFVSGDHITGPFRTNDSILVEGAPTWHYEAISSNPAIRDNPSYPGYNVLNSGNPNFLAGRPVFQERMNMPPSNDGIRDVARVGHGGVRGCVYQGPTHVTLLDDGRMRVVSPRTANNTAGPGCPNTGGTGALPANGVLYVESSSGCGGGTSHPLRQGQLTNWVIPNTDRFTYQPCAGDLFVQGTLFGHLTMAAANDIIITDHLRYSRPPVVGQDGDLLGLIAQGQVWVFRPMTTAGVLINRRVGGVFRDPQIDAAILSVTGTFGVQNVNRTYNGNDANRRLGDLRVRGAIIQIYRGPVGAGTPPNHIGYLKDYNYDWRLQRISPPFFIQPEEAQFRMEDWAERPAQDG